MMNFNAQTFDKYQEALLFCANSKWFRWILGLNRLPKDIKVDKFYQITPNSIHWIKSIDENGIPTLETAIFARNRFAEALAHNLSPFVYFQSRKRAVWTFSPVGVIGALAMLFVPKIGFMGFFATTTDFPVGPGDGVVSLSGLGNNSYSTWRDGSTGTFASDTTTVGNDGNQAGCPYVAVDGNSRYIGGRAFLPVDTSVLTGGANISAASLFLCTDSLSRVTYANNNVEITESTVVSSSALATTDFNKWNSVKWATGIAHDSLASAGNFSEFVLNSTGYGAINKTGFSKYSIRYGYDVDNSAPGLAGGSRIVYSFRFSHFTGTSSDPYLRVTYTLAGLVFPPFVVKQAVKRAALY